MATNKTQAAKLLNAAEMAVFNASLASEIKELSATRLAGKQKRARSLRDKFRDLLQRQRLATRQRTGTKAGASGSANERTAKKAEIFDELLQRFSARLEQVQAASAREAARAEKARAKRARTGAPKTTVKAAVKAAVAKKAAVKKTAARTAAAGQAPARSAKAPALAPGVAAKGVGPGSQQARAAAKAARLDAAGARPIQGYIASTDRRAQIKRDSKG